MTEPAGKGLGFKRGPPLRQERTVPAGKRGPLASGEDRAGRSSWTPLSSGNRGLIQGFQVGVSEARSRKKNRLSQSAQRAGRAQPTQRTLQWAYILYTNVAT